jgi:hypothetical protein
LYGQAGSGGGAKEASGWMEGLVKKLIMNVTLKVENLIIKYEEGDIVASLNLWYVALKGRAWKGGREAGIGW